MIIHHFSNLTSKIKKSRIFRNKIRFANKAELEFGADLERREKIILQFEIPKLIYESGNAGKSNQGMIGQVN